jgi:hypothetical protein
LVAEFEVPLAAAVRGLRAELVEAVREGAGEELRFALGPVVLEVELALTREAAGKAGIRFWVVSAGGKGSRSEATTHRMKLTLTPVRVDADGVARTDVVVGSEVSGRPR